VKAVIIALALSVFLVTGCNRSGKSIHIILPNGFGGEFQIVKDSQRGQDLVEENGSWVFRIPRDGKLYVKQDWPFYQGHTETVQYENGQDVANKDLGTTAGSRSTGPNRVEASTEFDGTTHRWRVANPP
jgi:hypothetical protein